MTGGAAGTATTAGANAAGDAQGGKAGGGAGGGSAGREDNLGGAPDVVGGMPGAAGVGEGEPVTVQITDFSDTYVTSCKPETNWADESRLIVDRETGGPGEACTHLSLVRASLSAIPSGSKIEAAKLSFSCSSTGDPVSVSYVEEAWEDHAVLWSNRPDGGNGLGTITCRQVGPLTLDVTAAVSAWSSGRHGNFGVYLSVTGTDGTELASSEAESSEERPRLSVTYRAPE